MRTCVLLLVLAITAWAQDVSQPPAPATSPAGAAQSLSDSTLQHRATHPITIPNGTHIPISLRDWISTKNSRAGDQVYAQTNFPVVIDEHIVIPAGTYVQGKITSIKPAGRLKGRAEVLMHFTSMIYPSGYTVLLPGSIEDAPSVDKAKVKDKEGTIQADGDNGRKVRTIGEPAATGAITGAVIHGGEGALIGGGAGAAVGTLIASLTHGNEVRLGPGTTFELILQRDVTVDYSRIGSGPFERRRGEY